MHFLRFQNKTCHAVIASTGCQDKENREWTGKQQTAILQALLQKLEGHTIKRCSVKIVAEQFNVGRNTVGRI